MGPSSVVLETLELHQDAVTQGQRAHLILVLVLDISTLAFLSADAPAVGTVARLWNVVISSCLS